MIRYEVTVAIGTEITEISHRSDMTYRDRYRVVYIRERRVTT